MKRLALALLGVLLAATVAVADPPAADTPLPVLPPPSAAEAMPLKLAPASEGWATTRLVGVLVIMLLGIPVLLVARRRKGGLAELVSKAPWLSHFVAEPVAPEDRIDIVSRRALSQREWLAVVRIGDERFFVAASAMRVSLLSRLADVRPAPAPPDFAAELTARAASVALEPAPATEASEDALRSAVARARARLARLAETEGAGRRA